MPWSGTQANAIFISLVVAIKHLSAEAHIVMIKQFLTLAAVGLSPFRLLLLLS